MGLLPQIKWHSIYAKLLATYLLLTTLGTCVMAGYIIWSFHAYFMKVRQSEMRNWSTAIAESVADALQKNDRKLVELIVQRYGAAETITLRVFDSKGQLLATSSPKEDLQVNNWLAVAGIQTVLETKSEVQGTAKGVLSNEDRLFITRPIIRNRQLMGILRMSISLQQFQRQFTTVIQTMLGTLAFTLLVCTAISERLGRSLSHPIEKMKNFAIRMGSGHFGDKLEIHESNELDQLAVELNRMSERLASLDLERRAFLANVSHELRTPISNVLVTVEALRSGADSDPIVRDRFFQNLEDEIKRLSCLVNDLLDLGRLEAGVLLLERQKVELSSLIRRAIKAIETRMQNLQISACVNLAELQIQGDPQRLLQVFLNLLDNAMKHSAANSQIFITGYKEGKQAVITIRDQGTGIKDSDLPHIFEQFYTGDRSRQGRRVGLGLAIAKRIVEAHGGSICASSKFGQGATFTIYLPLI
jgi:signal transduction histidine kinase